MPSHRLSKVTRRVSHTSLQLSHKPKVYKPSRIPLSIARFLDCVVAFRYREVTDVRCIVNSSCTCTSNQLLQLPWILAPHLASFYSGLNNVSSRLHVHWRSGVQPLAFAKVPHMDRRGPGLHRTSESPPYLLREVRLVAPWSRVGRHVSRVCCGMMPGDLVSSLRHGTYLIVRKVRCGS